MIKISVNASKKYDVVMEHGALASAGTYICEALDMIGMDSTDPNLCVSDRKICIVTDSNVDKLYGQPEHKLFRSLEASGFKVYKYVFPGGESHKTITTITEILEYLANENFTRSDLLLALGGGIAGDITGFAASIYLRGVDFIQVPTTLLAIVDSSVGGKTGVNLDSGKNLAGAFWQPRLVLFDPDVLNTLSDHLKLDGVAEALKAGFIADPDIVAMLDRIMSVNGSIDDNDMLTKLAAMAVKVKCDIVEEDERESNKRQLLNLGHTAAHAIEKCSNYTISHGHAVAMGMAIVSKASVAYNWCEEICFMALLHVLNDFDFSLECPYTAAELAHAALHDKKRRGNDITLVIPEKIGSCSLKKIPVDELEEFFTKGLERN